MRKQRIRLTESQLKNTIRRCLYEAMKQQRTDEGRLARGFGKAALGAAGIIGGIGAIGHSFDQLDKMEQGYNQDSKKNMNVKSTDTYNKWCQQHNLDPEDEANVNQFYDTDNSELDEGIRRAIKKVLKETSLYTDDPYHNAEYSYEDPRYDYPNGKEGDIDYSWDEFDTKNGNLTHQRNYQHHLMDLQSKGRDMRNNWTPKELSRGEHQKNRFLQGKSLYDFDQEV